MDTKKHMTGWSSKVDDDGNIVILIPGHDIIMGDLEEVDGCCFEVARLIATAPILLEACKKAKARWDKIGLTNLNQVGLEEYGILCSAINQAEVQDEK